MRWSRGALAAVIVFTVAAVQMPASAHTKGYRTTARLEAAQVGSPGLATGEIGSPNNLCVRGRPVSVFDGSRLVGTATANDGGAFQVQGTVEAGDRLHARVDKKVLRKSSKHRHTCGADTSNTVTMPVQLQIGIVGNGSVTDGDGITCTDETSPCIENVAPGRTIVLTPSPDAGATFSGWSGACTGSGPTCTVSMSTTRAVVAQFTTSPIPVSRVLEVAVSGPGRVRGPGINCTEDGGDCVEDHAINTQVTLTATPEGLLGLPLLASFDGWSGSCSGTATTCTLTISTDRQVGATFSSLLPDPLDDLVDTLAETLGLA